MESGIDLLFGMWQFAAGIIFGIIVSLTIKDFNNEKPKHNNNGK